jgi:single-strand DNA-binding protein
MSARSLNRATLIGNIGKDPELRKTPQGTSVCTIRLATTEIFKNRNGERQEATDWHSVVLWDRLAEIAAELLRKSDKIFVEGKIRTRTFEKDGQKKHFTEIIANKMIILDKKNRAGDTVLDEVAKEEVSNTDSSDIFGNDEILTSDDVFGTSNTDNKIDF